MEDFDDSSLEYSEWVEHMTQVVRNYNEEFGTMYNPYIKVIQFRVIYGNR